MLQRLGQSNESGAADKGARPEMPFQASRAEYVETLIPGRTVAWLSQRPLALRTLSSQERRSPQAMRTAILEAPYRSFEPHPTEEDK
jgi:hypothetical protein